jgi:hypothetical protein
VKTLTTLTKLELEALQKALPHMNAQEKAELLADLEEREKRARLVAAQDNMLGFAKAVYPGFKVGPHHRKLAKIFTDVIEGRKKRVIINIAPRMGKSEFSSYLFPAYFLGKYPQKKIIMGTHTAGLSEDFGRRIRNLLDGDEYKEVFPATVVADDQKAAGKWSTSVGGQYYAAGVGGASQTTNSTSGTAGTAGGLTSFGTLVVAGGGLASGAGALVTAAGGNVTNQRGFLIGGGGGNGTIGAVGGVGTAATAGASAPGGGGGGGISVTPAAFAGGVGGAQTWAGLTGGTAGTLGGGNHFIITDRTAGLDKTTNAISGGDINAIAKREKGI